MKKLIQGIVDFRKNVRPQYKETFAKLALGQSPDSLFIACSDSRVVPNLFASSDPGDLFVIRNVGNLIPPAEENGVSTADESEAAAIEFALTQLQVSDIIICGHSECGAMQKIATGRQNVQAPNLRAWLRHGEAAIQRSKDKPLSKTLEPHNHISQSNVLLQLEHIQTYPVVQEKIKQGKLRLHAWWFELKNAEVYSFSAQEKKFVLLDEKEAEKILDTLH